MTSCSALRRCWRRSAAAADPAEPRTPRQNCVIDRHVPDRRLGLVFDLRLTLRRAAPPGDHKAGPSIHGLLELVVAADALRVLGPLGEFAVDIQRTLAEFALKHTRLAGFDLPDPIAMAVALDPDVATDVRRVHVAVERRGDLTRGQTVVDHDARFGEQNVDVVFAASRERFLALLHDALRS